VEYLERGEISSRLPEFENLKGILRREGGSGDALQIFKFRESGRDFPALQILDWDFQGRIEGFFLLSHPPPRRGMKKQVTPPEELNPLGDAWVELQGVPGQLDIDGMPPGRAATAGVELGGAIGTREIEVQHRDAARPATRQLPGGGGAQYPRA